MDEEKMMAALQELQQYCKSNNCSQCPFRNVFGCIPAGGEMGVPCTWEFEMEGVN